MSLGRWTLRPDSAAALALEAAGIWLASRAALLLASALVIAFGTGGGQGWAHWAQWDARWYLAIAGQGYQATSYVNGPVFCPCVPVEATSFFPLYPALIAAVQHLIGATDPLGPALAIANLAALAGTILLALLGRQLGLGRGAALAAVAAMLAYPLAFFTFAPYTESIFLALAAATRLAALRRRWGWAAAAGAAAALARPTAVALAAALAWEAFRQLREPAPRRLRTWAAMSLGVASVPIGLAAVSLLDRAVYGDALAWAHSHGSFHHQHLTGPWTTLQMIGSALAGTTPEWRGMIMVDLGTVLAAGLVTVVAIGRIPGSLWLYQAVLVLLPLLLPSYTFFGMDVLAAGGRYMAVSIPAFLVLGGWMHGRPWLRFLVVGGGALLQAVLLARYLSGAWVG